MWLSTTGCISVCLIGFSRLCYITMKPKVYGRHPNRSFPDYVLVSVLLTFLGYVYAHNTMWLCVLNTYSYKYWLHDLLVQACHKNGVMHRDLKPENFLFANSRENSPLKAIDFGLSIFFKPGASPFQKEGATNHDNKFEESPYYFCRRDVFGDRRKSLLHGSWGS